MANSLFTRSVTRGSKANDPHGRAPLMPTSAAVWVWGPIMSPVRPARRLGKIPRRRAGWPDPAQSRNLPGTCARRRCMPVRSR
eukprot:scaffold354_cov116-Isochrysis_galbana.AAC.11